MFSLSLHLPFEAFTSFPTLVLKQTAKTCEFCFTFRVANYCNSILQLSDIQTDLMSSHKHLAQIPLNHKIFFNNFEYTNEKTSYSKL